MVVVVTFQETVVRYKVGRQAISRLEVDQPASSVRTTRSFLHLHYILLELSLASNGATLSDRALSILAELAGIHGFDIVVDEIMTGGRTKRMLSTMDKPKNFQKSVDFITMGKWLKCGMVLSSKRQHTMLRELLERQLPR